MSILNSNPNSIIKRPPTHQQLQAPQNPNTDEEPKPEWRRFDDVTKTRQYIYDNVLRAAQRNAVTSNARHTLRLTNLKYANEGVYNLAQQKAAILANKSLHRRLVGDWELVDNQTNQVLDRRPNITVAQVPFYTDRGTFIIRGTEYSLANQLRLRPGIYTRIKDNGEIEAHANLIPGKGLSHRYFLDPAKGVFYINIGQAKIPLTPLLKAMGASDKQLQEAWGNELWQANAQQNNPALLNKIIRKLVRDSKVEDKQKALLDAFAKMEVDPTVTQRTLGKPYSRIDLDSILATTKKLLAVSRGEMDVDDRDHMAYQNVFGPEELIAERLDKDWAGIRRALLFKSSFKGDLSPIRPGALTKQLQAAILFSGLGSCFDKKTLVLTRRGWLPWPEVEDDDEFACRIDGKVEYHRARRIIREFYTGEMIGCANKYVNYLVTPNHRMWCRPRKKKSKYRFVTAEKLFGKSCYFETSLGPLRKPKRMDYITLNWVENRHGHKKSVKIDIDTWLQFLGWWLAEGSAFKLGPRGYVVTIAQKNDKYRPEIEAILDKMPFHWRIGSHGNDYIIASKGLYEHLVLNCGTKADKRIPRYVFELHEDKLRLLFDCIMKGDGNNYHGYIKIQLAAIGLVHDLAELWSRFNKTAQVTWQDRTVEGWKIYATASFSDVTKRGVVSQGRLVDKGISNYYYEDYDDLVYCAEVPGNMLFVMRNGRPMWASNSIEEINSSELLDKQSRFTRLGEGGIGSSSAVPRECYDDKTEVFTSAGWLPWAEVTDKTLLACKIDGRMEFHKPIKLIAQHYKGMMYGCKTRTLNYLVTPNHRMWVKSADEDYHFETAEECFGKPRIFDCSLDGSKHYSADEDHYYYEDYDGVVYCAEVPGGLLYVRRNKSIGMWSGNSRSIQPSHAGFVDPVRTPECGDPSTEVYTQAGWKFWPDVTEQDKLACLIDGEMKFLPPIRLIKAHYDGEMIGIKTAMIDSLVTPNHRMWVKFADEDYRFEVAEECFGQPLTIDCSLDGSRAEQHAVKSEDYYKTHYKGFVYCAEVPGGLLYVRRNNSTGMWSGNSLKAGVDANFASPVYKAPDGKIYAPFIDVKTGRKVYRSPQDVADLTIAFPGELERNPNAKRVGAMRKGRLGYFPREEVDLVMPHFENAFSSLANTVPAKSASKAQRLAMAARMQTQAVSLIKREAPLVRTAIPDDPNSSYQEVVGRQMGIVYAEKPGMVVSVSPDEIKVKYDDGTTEVKSLYNNFPYARKTHVHNTPLVKPGDRFGAGTVLASNNYTDDTGTMALGLNARVAYIPYKGHNFEDAVVISESFAKRLASEHMYQEGIEWGADYKKGKNNFISIFPGKYKPQQLENIDSNGYAKPGTVVNHGDPIILAARQRETVKNKLHRKKEASFVDASVKWEHYTPGVVTDVVTTDKGVTALVKSINEVQVGDKLCYSRDTEVLTSLGWKLVSELVEGELVASLNPETGKLEYVPVVKLHSYEHDGRMYSLETTQVSLLVTDNHKLWARLEGDKEYSFYEAQQLAGKKYYVKDQTEEHFIHEDKWFAYSGEVFCPTLERNHILYVRRNGKPVWCGNSGLYGDKGVVSHIVPDDQMPTDEQGTPFEMLVSPLGVISRTNSSQMIEGALGKIARKTGKPYRLKDFSDIEDLTEFALSELKKHNIPLKETLIDPETGRKIPNVFTGERYIMKLHHLAECYDDQTEVLTKRGWVKWENATPDDLFATIENDKLIYEKPLELIKSHYAGPLYCFSGRFVDYAVTPNHRMYGRHSTSREFGFKSAEEIHMDSFVVLTLGDDPKEGTNNVTELQLEHTSHCKFFTQAYAGYVYCATMRTGLLYVRRNGKPMLCGNSKGQGRGIGGYTLTDEPAKGGEKGSKRISLIDLNALLASGATQVIRDAAVIRGQRNEEYWLPFMQGFNPPPPKVPMIYQKFIHDLKAAGINVVPDGPRLNIMAMTNKDIDELAGDRVITSGDTVRFEKGLEPIKGGLFDPALTGGHNGTRWCFRADTKIWTEQGMLTIGEIVNNRLRVKVKSYNFETGCFEWQPVTNWFTNIATDGVGKAKFVGPSGRLAREFPGFNYKTLHSTANHQVFRLDGTKQAISDASTLLAACELLSYSQEQLLYGTLLGDGYVTPDGVYTAAHCEAQLGYAQFKYDILSPLIKRPVECFLDNSGGCKRRKVKFRTCAHAAMHEARQLCYVGGRKTISQEWLNKIDELGLAFWVMDDGSVRRSKAKSTITVSLHTEGFSLEGVKLLQAWLQERWGCNSFIARDNAKYKDRDCGWYLVVSGDSAETILDIIAPYVPDAMRYKIPGRPVTGVCRKCGSEVAKRRRHCNSCQLLEAEQCGTSKLPKHTRRLFGGTAAVRELLQSNNIPEENLGAAVKRWSDREAIVGTAVEAVRQDIKIRHGLKEISCTYTHGSKSKRARTMLVYDIEVAGNHNYFANGILVSNSKIKLEEPMPNPVMVEPIRRLLGVTEKKFEDVLAGRDEIRGQKGPQGIKKLLEDINIDKEIDIAREHIKSGRRTYRDAAVRRLKYLKAAKQLKVHPSEWMLDSVPVLPPKFRPIAVMSQNKLPLISDANYLYKELISANDILRDIKKEVDDVGDERLAVYGALKAVVGLGDPVHPKLKEKNVKGILKSIFGTGGPKTGTVQRRLISSTVDLVGRAVITPDPDLNMDEVALPENRAWSVYRNFVIRRLRRRGMPLIEAARQVEDRSKIAREELMKEMEHRPVIINRAPVLHKFGIMAFWPKLTKDETLKVSPLIVKGFNADFDGDAMQYHVPVDEDARKEAIELMMPSKNLLSPADFNRPMHTPSQDYVSGLYIATASRKTDRKARTFKKLADAIAAYKRGEIEIDDPIEIED